MKVSYSAWWEEMMSNWANIEDHSFRAIGDGTQVLVWKNKWILPSIRVCDLVDHVPRNLGQLIKLMISFMIIVIGTSR